MNSFFSDPFLLMPLLAGLAASVTSGIMGSFVVTKRIVFIAGSIAHSVLGGMGLFLFLQRKWEIEWLSPMQGAIFAALFSALLIGWIHLKYQQREDTVIAAIWSTGMSIGVIFISLTPGYNVELNHYLFGNILWITKKDILLLVFLDTLIVTFTVLFRHQFLTICFDEEQAKLQKISPSAYYLFLLCLIALSVVLLIQVVGAILVIAMLAIPAAIASNWTYRFSSMLLYAVALGGLFNIGGLTLSYHLNWPPGATIALLAAGCYLISFTFQRKQKGIG